MKRRNFITLIGAVAATWPLAGRVRSTERIPTIGFLGAATAAAWQAWTAAFVERLHELGWAEGRRVAIEYRWAEGQIERQAEIATEFARLKVDVIVTAGTPAILAAKRATSTIPIVFVLATAPVESGLVASLARPGGNVTGLSLESADVASKRLELLREALPGLRRLAIMANAKNVAASIEMRDAEAAARTFGYEVTMLDVGREEDIPRAFETLKGRVDAIYVVIDAFINTNRNRINALALSARLPTVHGSREAVQAGGLMSYGANFVELYQRAAGYVDRILRGAKPGDLPVEQPTKFDLVVNLKSAKALDLEIPPTLLARADEVIE